MWLFCFEHFQIIIIFYYFYIYYTYMYRFTYSMFLTEPEKKSMMSV